MTQWGADHTDSLPSLSDRGFMCDCIDALGQPTDDSEVVGEQSLHQLTSASHAVITGLARSYNGD